MHRLIVFVVILLAVSAVYTQQRAVVLDRNANHMRLVSTKYDGNTKIMEFVNKKTGRKYKVHDKNGMFYIKSLDGLPTAPEDQYDIALKL